MKHIFKRNQIIIAALAVMIAAAGYLNYSGRLFQDKEKTTQTSAELASQELLDISEEDVETSSEDIESVDGEAKEDGSVEGTPGEAVLTSGEASAVVAEAKVTREQVRAKNKETLQEIIDNDTLSEAQKKEALDQMAAETLLASKGFAEAVVSLSEDSADVVMNASELSDANRAQIEDIITRKTGVAAENIVITPIHTEKVKSEKKEK